MKQKHEIHHSVRRICLLYALIYAHVGITRAKAYSFLSIHVNICPSPIWLVDIHESHAPLYSDALISHCSAMETREKELAESSNKRVLPKQYRKEFAAVNNTGSLTSVIAINDLNYILSYWIANCIILLSLFLLRRLFFVHLHRKLQPNHNFIYGRRVRVRTTHMSIPKKWGFANQNSSATHSFVVVFVAGLLRERERVKNVALHAIDDKMNAKVVAIDFEYIECVCCVSLLLCVFCTCFYYYNMPVNTLNKEAP